MERKGLGPVVKKLLCRFGGRGGVTDNQQRIRF